MSPEPDDYYVAPDEYSAYVGNRVTADRPDYLVSPSWDAGLTDSDYETLRGLGYSDSDLRALFEEFYREPETTTVPEGDELNPYRQPVDRTDELNPYVKPGEEQVEDELNPYRQKPGAGATPGGTTGGTTGGGAKPGGTGGLSDTFRTAAKALGLTDDKGALNPLMFLGLAGILSQLNKGSGSSAPTGYQGTVPTYTAVRQQIQYPDDPNRRPGAGGRQYFTPTQYVDTKDVTLARAAADAAAQQAAREYKMAAAPTVKKQQTVQEQAEARPASEVSMLKPVPEYTAESEKLGAYRVQPAAQGGLMNLAKGRYLDGPTDGMADKIPATIADKQPARLSHGEFVVPADVVSHLGNGNSNAGAERLYDMMDRIRKARTGNTKQGKQINPNKFLPT